MTYYELEVYIPLIGTWIPRGMMGASLTDAKIRAFEPFGKMGWEVEDVRESKKWFSGGEKREQMEMKGLEG